MRDFPPSGPAQGPGGHAARPPTQHLHPASRRGTRRAPDIAWADAEEKLLAGLAGGWLWGYGLKQGESDMPRWHVG